jgi:hypothetical protein
MRKEGRSIMRRNLTSTVLFLTLGFFFVCQSHASVFTDNFSSSAIDYFWWTPSQANGNTVSLNTANHNIEMYQGTTNGSAALSFNFPLVGDFVIEADYKTTNWVLGGNEQQRIGIVGSNGISVQRVSDWWFGGEVYLTYEEGASWHTGSPTTTDLEGRLRLVRIGSTINGYYWDKTLNGGAGDWALAPRTPAAYTGPFQFSLVIWSGYEGTQIGNIIAWDNIYVNAPGMANPGSVGYATFAGNGIWTYDGDTWIQITPNNPTSMVASGWLLYGNFGAGGIWTWGGTSWSQLTPYSPTDMVASGSLLYGSFGNGIWEWDGTAWSQITSYAPTGMAASGYVLYGTFGNGIWKWDGKTWSQITPYAPTAMVAEGSLLYGNFGNGIWKWDGTAWSQVTPYAPTGMAASGYLLYGSFGNGIWKWDGTTWSQATPYSPTAMVAVGSQLYGSFGNGIWMYNGTTWSQITPYAPTSMVTN